VRSAEEEVTNEELAELYRTYGFVLRRRCRVLLRDEAAADDALQESFLKFLQSIGELRAAENKLAWMYRVVDRTCFDLIRRRKVRQVEALDDERAEGGCHPAVAIEARDAVLKLLPALTEGEFHVAVLAYVDGVSQTDIATRLGLSRPTIWKRLTAVRERVTKMIGDPS